MFGREMIKRNLWPMLVIAAVAAVLARGFTFPALPMAPEVLPRSAIAERLWPLTMLPELLLCKPG
jgi:hypothetical protein